MGWGPDSPLLEVVGLSRRDTARMPFSVGVSLPGDASSVAVGFAAASAQHKTFSVGLHLRVVESVTKRQCCSE